MVAKLTIPDVCLVVLIGASDVDRATFARRHFRPSEVVSSALCRTLVADDEIDGEATAAGAAVLHTVVAQRLAGNRLTVVDDPHLDAEARAPLVASARKHHVPVVAVVTDVSAQRHGPRAWPEPDEEGFDQVIVLDGADEAEGAVLDRVRSPADRRDLHGPFDIVGDVHGCSAELVELLGRLGYEIARDGSGGHHPQGRWAVFLGDLVDRGPDTPGVLRLVMGMVRSGSALCLPGNHETKLVAALRGREVDVGHGLAESLRRLDALPADFRTEVVSFVDGLPRHLVLDDGRLVLAHAGLPERFHNRRSAHVDRFAVYGDVTWEEIDDRGRPMRYRWADDYRGAAQVVYGHTPVAAPEWVNNTICIDTGCVYGGALTALRYPENSLVSVPARSAAWTR